MNTETVAILNTLEALTERVQALEAHAEANAHSPSDASSTVASADFWALHGVEQRRASDPSTTDGVVMLVGSVTLPDGSPVAWQESAGTAGLLEVDWANHAASFAALGHPVRIELLRHVLSGTHATADLAAIESLGTTGQLHHHLRQLISTGWLRQSGRGNYEVPAARVVPLLVAVVGAAR